MFLQHPTIGRLIMALAPLALALVCAAQTPDNRVQQRVVIDSDTLRLDSLSIVPGSFSLWKDAVEIPPERYSLDPFRALLIRRDSTLHDTLMARYRVMPLLLGGIHRHKDRELLLRPSGDRVDPFKYEPGQQTQDPFGMGGLSKSGSISRGILFGNNQDLSVNSSLNMELNGQLTDKISLQASITDNNIPIQAGGNTLELQDFDQVFIKLFDDRQELVGGDFVMERPESHFLNFHKKSKGISYRLRSGDVDGPNNRMGISAAISKGSFQRNRIQGREGVQGPYRLRADGGGTFIIVLSGTEKVYLDGRLLTRGMENDYVIDYNSAELTFTTKCPINKDSRIVVEFQYSDKNYARSLVHLADRYERGRTRLRFNLYSEQDHKGQTLQQSLSDVEKEALMEAGDDPMSAVVQGGDSVAFSADEVLYARVDSLGWWPVYRYSTDPDSAHYRVSFSSVGAGNGDYVQQEFTPNGRVFRWVAPDTVGGNIVHRGDHSPVRVLVPPRLKRMATLGADHRFNERTKAWAEVAFSQEDRNLYSDLDDADNFGMAVHAGVSHAIALSRTDTTKRLIVGTDNEWRSRNLVEIERTRSVEFDRDWNLGSGPQAGSQLLTQASVGFINGRNGHIDLTGSLFRAGDAFSGLRQALNGKMRMGKYDAMVNGSLLQTTAGGASTNFIRNKAMLSRRFKGFTLGVQDELEHNRFRNDSLGGLLQGSYRYNSWEAFIQSPDSAKARFRFSGGQRIDEAEQGGALLPSTEATQYTSSIDLSGPKVRKLSANFNYRRLRIRDSTLTAQRPENTYLARVDHGHSAFQGMLNWDLFYEFGSGLEQRREYIYVQVPAGQGTYVWIDYNGDGVKDLNEFEPAPFSYEADHIRVYVQSNETERVYSNQLSASAELRPSARWRDQPGFKGFLAKWNDLASFRSDRKTAGLEGGQAFNPFLLDAVDSTMVALNSSARNTLYYNRSSRSWSADHTWQSDRTKSLLINGFESRVRESHLVHLRWNTTTNWTLELEGRTGRTTNGSNLLAGRNYAIDERSTAPKLTWQPNTRMRAMVRFNYQEKKNTEEYGGEVALVRDLGAEFRLNTAGKGSVQFNANLVDISYNGSVDSSLGTEMLVGLKPGTNITWSLAFQRRLSDHLQVDITYNGRSSPHVPMVHVGGAQVRAFF